MDREVDVTFESKWDFIFRRRANVVQERSEMEYAHSLIEACKPESYLEIGTAEGDSLFVFGSLLPEHGHIHWIDKAEKQTQFLREQSEKMLAPRAITSYRGLSTDVDARVGVQRRMFDVVYIDGGHDYETVLADCRNYVPLARKLVLWHDIQMPDVKRALDEYMNGKPYETFINSDTMGYAILKVKND